MTERNRLWWVLLFLALCGISLVGARQLQFHLYPFPQRELVQHYAGVHDLNPHLVAAVIRVESRWRVGATSPKGARGLMQIMPATGSWIAAQLGDQGFDAGQLYEPDLNIRYGTWYLAYLISQFGGQLTPALAAYNGGSHNVRAWLAEGRWTGEVGTLSQVPFEETREFVIRVVRNYERYERLYGRGPGPPGSGPFDGRP